MSWQRTEGGKLGVTWLGLPVAQERSKRTKGLPGYHSQCKKRLWESCLSGSVRGGRKTAGMEKEKMLWHRSESRRQTEKTNIFLQPCEAPAYSKRSKGEKMRCWEAKGRILFQLFSLFLVSFGTVWNCLTLTGTIWAQFN